MQDNEIPTVWYSRGSFFRHGAEILYNLRKAPDSLTQTDVELVTSSIRTGIINGELRPLIAPDQPMNHSFANGDIAALYANNEIFQEGMRNFLRELKEDYPSYVAFIEEGREPADDDGLTFVVTTNPQTSVEIKRIEYGEETSGLSDLEIAETIFRRNRLDEAFFTTLFQMGKAYFIPRTDASAREHQKVVKTIGEIVMKKFNGENLPPYGIIFP